MRFLLKIFKAVRRAIPYLEDAIQVVRWIESIIGDRPGWEKRQVAEAELGARFPNAQTRDINRAIEVAVEIVKDEKPLKQPSVGLFHSLQGCIS